MRPAERPAPGIRLLSAGVDTLELTARKRLAIPACVERAASEAFGAQEPVPLRWVGPEGIEWELDVSPGGAQFVLLKGRDFSLKLPRSARSRIPASIDVRAETLWTLGPQRAARLILGAVHALLGVPEATEADWRVSRADLCVDVHARFSDLDSPRWRRLARKWRRFNEATGKHEEKDPESDTGTVEVFDDGLTFSGWRFGAGGPLLARVYLKSLQAEHGSPWIFDVWREAPDYDPARDVWRIEFQARRCVLMELGVDTLADLWEKQAAVWRYLTWSWLSLRATRQHDKERAISPAWRLLSERGFSRGALELVEPAKRRKVKDASDLRRCLPQLRGLVASALAQAVAAGQLDKKAALRTDLAGAMRVLAPVYRKAEQKRIIKKTELRRDVALALQRRASHADDAAKATGKDARHDARTEKRLDVQSLPKGDPGTENGKIPPLVLGSVPHEAEARQ